MRFLIYTNTYKDIGCAVAKQTAQILGAAKHEYSIVECPRERLAFGASAPDAVVTIGGDGTILSAAEQCAKNGVPIIGVNMGTTGFLAEVEQNEIELIATAGNAPRFSRAMLRFCANSVVGDCLNEIVVLRKNNQRVLNIDLAVDGAMCGSFCCDGLIAATPTGSTAYSLSAGGPIVNPNSSVIVLTPVNSHSLNSRPMVIDDKSKITITVSENNFNGADVVFDGMNAASIERGQPVEIMLSPFRLEFISFNKDSFYAKLINKLNKWSI